MRVLITGGNGYVGRELTRLLVVDHEVCVFDAFRNSELRFPKDELGRFALQRGDLRDPGAVAGIVERFAPQVVIHLAAIHFIPDCERQPDEAIGINTLGTVNLLRALPEGTRFVLASTAAVYAPENTPHDEMTSPVGPMDVYGLTKWHAEEYVRYFAGQRGIDARIVRLFNVIGPGETNPHLLPAILAQVLHGARTLHLGNTSPKRDYVNVTDVAAGFAAVAFGEPAVPESEVDVVNLGTGSGYSVEDVVRRLETVIGEPLRIEVDPARVRPVDRPFLAASTSRMAAHYRWRAETDITESLRRLWADPDIPTELLQRS